MSAAETTAASAPRVRWSWLWGAKFDFAWNLIPMWLGFAIVAALFMTLNAGANENPLWSFSFSGHQFNILALGFVVFGPLVDGPHLWATIARTYTDAEEWAARRKLFVTSLLAFAIGPAIILIPYVVNAVTPIPAPALEWGWNVWIFGFTAYTLFHISRQHWGLVGLYRRKNGEKDPLEARIDSIFCHIAIGLPFVAWMSTPGPADAFAGLRTFLFDASHVLFLTACTAYLLFQVQQWRQGVVRNGPKLLYIATVVPLYYLTFAFSPIIAAFWVLIIGTGHCAQYHAVVWDYGKKRYAVDEKTERRLPHLIFSNFWLYAVLALLFMEFTLQGPGAGALKEIGSRALQSEVFSHVFAFLNAKDGEALGIKVLTAFISGVRLHHFYVDSKIWRSAKTPAAAAA